MIDFNDSKARQWEEAAEETKILTALGAGLNWESGQDGEPHLAYFDPERQLSFLWDGNPRTPIQVSQGGYGEPISWKFFYNDFVIEAINADYDADVSASGLHGLVLRYRTVCNLWIAKTEASL